MKRRRDSKGRFLSDREVYDRAITETKNKLFSLIWNLNYEPLQHMMGHRDVATQVKWRCSYLKRLKKEYNLLNTFLQLRRNS